MNTIYFATIRVALIANSKEDAHDTLCESLGRVMPGSAPDEPVVDWNYTRTGTPVDTGMTPNEDYEEAFYFGKNLML